MNHPLWHINVVFIDPIDILCSNYDYLLKTAESPTFYFVSVFLYVSVFSLFLIETNTTF